MLEGWSPENRINLRIYFEVLVFREMKSQDLKPDEIPASAVSTEKASSLLY